MNPLIWLSRESPFYEPPSQNRSLMQRMTSDQSQVDERKPLGILELELKRISQN